MGVEKTQEEDNSEFSESENNGKRLEEDKNVNGLGENNVKGSEQNENDHDGDPTGHNQNNQSEEELEDGSHTIEEDCTVQNSSTNKLRKEKKDNEVSTESQHDSYKDSEHKAGLDGDIINEVLLDAK